MEELNDSQYYYCTKNVKFLKTDVLRKIHYLFESRLEQALEVSEIYAYLKRQLKVNFVNKRNLFKLLNITKADIILSKADFMKVYNSYSITGTSVEKQRDIRNEQFYNDLVQQMIDYGQPATNLSFYKKYYDIKVTIDEISVDNFNLDLCNVFHPQLCELFYSFNAYKVKDLFNLTVHAYDQMLKSPYYQIYMAIIRKLKIKLTDALYEDFQNILNLIGPNGKSRVLPENADKYLDLIKMRASGVTLQAAGEKHGLTRERVRQIEGKYHLAFLQMSTMWSDNLSNILRTFSKSPLFIETSEFESIYGDEYLLFAYFLEHLNKPQLKYIEVLDAFKFDCDIDWYSEIMQKANSLPNLLNVSDVNNIATEIVKNYAEKGLNLSINTVKALLTQEFSKFGLLYSRNYLTQPKKTEYILRKYFPDGIRLYKDYEIEKFKQHYTEVFYDEQIPDNPRAIYGRIAHVSMLCGKGKYIAKKEHNISQELLKDICDYIDNSDKNIFLTNTIFYLFKDRLLAEGIDNKYHMQGIIHELLPHKYFYKRDYISKVSELTSVYSTIVDYVKKQNRPVPKTELLREFPHVTDNVFSLALHDKGVISGFRMYVHKDFVLSKKEELETIRKLMTVMAEDKKVHLADELLAVLEQRHPEVLKALQIHRRFDLYSIIKSVFVGEFSFKRPYFAKKGIPVKRTLKKVTVKKYFTMQV